jgi:hypothetical protein
LAKFVAPGRVGSCDAVGAGITPRKELVGNGVVGATRQIALQFVNSVSIVASAAVRACSIVFVRCTDRLTVVV